MKKIILYFAIAMSGYYSYAQTNTFPSTGNVGIGTTTPFGPLTVVGSAGGYSSTAHYIAGFFQDQTNYRGVYLGYDSAGQIGLISPVSTGDPSQLAFWNYSGTNWFEAMRLASNGNLLIGKTTQANTNYKLDINGSARANAIVVNTTGADFVFEDKYPLKKLSEIKEYINKNHHLPEIQSAKEMQTNGVDLGEMNTKLLQKVEELTLYMIELQKQNADLKKELMKTKKRNHLK